MALQRYVDEIALEQDARIVDQNIDVDAGPRESRRRSLPRRREDSSRRPTVSPRRRASR